MAFPHNGDENKPFKNIQLGTIPPISTGKQVFEGGESGSAAFR